MKQTGPQTLAAKASASRPKLSIPAPPPGTDVFWMVWAPSRRAPRQRHATKEAAVAEAERLALLNPDCQYNVYSARRIATRRGASLSTE